MTEDESTLRTLFTQAWLARAVCAAAELGLPGALRAGPAPIGAVARALGADERALRRLLRVLAGVGLVSLEAGDQVAGSDGLSLLGDDTPGSTGAVARLIGSSWHWRAWAHLTDAVRSGRPGYEVAHGRSLFSDLAADPGAARLFNAGVSLPPALDDALLSAIRVDPSSTIVDVGGGNGSFLLRLLERHPSATGAVVDLPGAIEAARQLIHASPAGARCRAVVGDFFAPLPASGTLFLLRWVLHNWDDEQAVRILRTVGAAMPGGSRLLVAEFVLPDEPALDPATIMDLEMLAICEGRERTFTDFSDLFVKAGLRLVGTHHTPALTVLEVMQPT